MIFNRSICLLEMLTQENTQTWLQTTCYTLTPHEYDDPVLLGSLSVQCTWIPEFLHFLLLVLCIQPFGDFISQGDEVVL